MPGLASASDRPRLGGIVRADIRYFNRCDERSASPRVQNPRGFPRSSKGCYRTSTVLMLFSIAREALQSDEGKVRDLNGVTMSRVACLERFSACQVVVFLKQETETTRKHDYLMELRASQ